MGKTFERSIFVPGVRKDLDSGHLKFFGIFVLAAFHCSTLNVYILSPENMSFKLYLGLFGVSCNLSM